MCNYLMHSSYQLGDIYYLYITADEIIEVPYKR